MNKTTFVSRAGNEVGYSKFNCGGLALETYDWYLPYGEEEGELDFLFVEGQESVEEAKQGMSDAYFDNIIRDMDTVEVPLWDVKRRLEEGETVVLFRMGYFDDEEIENMRANGHFDYDFHFIKLLRVNSETNEVSYMEKSGDSQIMEGTFSLDYLLYEEWSHYSYWCYNYEVRALLL